MNVTYERVPQSGVRWYLPSQLAAARARVAALENEARRYGMHYLLTHPEAVDEAWEREIAKAKRESGEA